MIPVMLPVKLNGNPIIGIEFCLDFRRITNEQDILHFIQRWQHHFIQPLTYESASQWYQHFTRYRNCYYYQARYNRVMSKV